MTRALVSALGVAAHRDALDLDFRPAWQAAHADRGARRLVRPEPLRVYLVHRLKVGEVGEEHGRLGDAVERRFRRHENCREIVEDTSRLSADVVASDELPALSVECDLPGAEDEIARDDRLAIRTDRSGGAVRLCAAKIHLLPLSIARRSRRAREPHHPPAGRYAGRARRARR